MDDLITSLEAKYSKSTSRKGKGKREPSVAPSEPSDEQFEAARYSAHSDPAVQSFVFLHFQCDAESVWPIWPCLRSGLFT